MVKLLLFLLLLPSFIGNKEPSFIRVICTAYSPEKRQCDSTPFITATNKRVKEGIIAVSKKLEELYPMRSVIEIGGKQYRVEDRMSKRWQDYRVDVFCWSKKEALEWGRKEMLVLLK